MTITQSRIAALINEHFGVEITTTDAHLNTRLIDELKLDSLDLVELSMAIEEEFHIEISDAEFEPFASDNGSAGKTVADLCALVEAKLAEKVAA